MKKDILICSLLLLFIFITSCSGQVKTDLSKDGVSELKIISNGQPKLIRTQGVVSGNVHCNLQDKAGNIWFSTSGEGVYRYDGKSFTNFTRKAGLRDNDVRAIIEDKAGNIVFGTKSGICK
jgi:ligand-binding sensor domain-containing protein